MMNKADVCLLIWNLVFEWEIQANTVKKTTELLKNNCKL